MSKKRISIYVGGLMIVLLVLITVSARRSSSKPEIKVKKGNIDLVVSAEGKVEGSEDVDLAPKTLGRINEIYIKEGDYVKKGDLIAVMENDELKAQVEQAKANVLRAEAELRESQQNWNRSTELYKKGIISSSELDTSRMKHDVATSQLKKSQADLQYANALLENTYIRAPFSGKIIKRFLDPGETITLEKLVPIVNIADVNKIKVRAEINDTDIGKLRIGQRAVVTTDAYPGEEFMGTVAEISQAVGKKSILSDNPAEMVDTKVLEVKIELDSGQKLKLGLDVDVTILANNKEDVLILPLKAVMQQDGTSYVTVKKNGKYEEKSITTGLSDDENIEVVEGLEEGDSVVLKNHSKF
jgi:RND family efflux transporter MFP subunit